MEAFDIFPRHITDAFGWTLVHSTWQGLLLGIALALLLVMLRRFSAVTKYRLAVSFLFLFLASTVLTFSLVYQPGPSTEPIVLAGNPGPMPDKKQVDLEKRTDISKDQEEKQSVINAVGPYLGQYFPLLVALWFIGILFFGLRLIANLVYIRRLKTHNVRPIGEFWENRCRTLSEKLKLTKKYIIQLSTAVSTPMVIGFFKPVILLPVSTLTRLSQQQVEAILVHELAHIRRNDFLVNTIQSIVELVFFYHPVVWWVSSRIRLERENCCDDLTVSVTGQNVDYAEALVNIGYVELEGKLSLAFSGKQNNLKQRVQRIFTSRNIFADLKERLVIVTVIVLGISSLGLGMLVLPDDRNGTTKDFLFEAIEQNEVDVVKKMAREGVDLDVKNKDGYTPLFLAVKNNNYEISKLLISNGADISTLQKDGRSILIEASDEEDHRLARLLVKHGAEINHVSKKRGTALHEAIRAGNFDVAEQLVKSGADLRLKDDDGRTPLMYAVDKEQLSIVQLLVDEGANVNFSNRDGWTVLMEAASAKSPEITQLLIDKGANVNAISYHNKTALFEAVEEERLENARILIEHGANVNSKIDELTPLCEAVRSNDYEMARLLIDNGAEVKARETEKGETVLIQAADEKDARIVKLLLDHGADANASRYDGRTALFESIESGKTANAKILIEYGADVNWQKFNDLSPLMYAIEKKKMDLVVLLIENGADVHARRKNNWDVTMIAERSGHNSIINYLTSQTRK